MIVYSVKRWKHEVDRRILTFTFQNRLRIYFFNGTFRLVNKNDRFRRDVFMQWPLNTLFKYNACIHYCSEWSRCTGEEREMMQLSTVSVMNDPFCVLNVEVETVILNSIFAWRLQYTFGVVVPIVPHSVMGRN